METVRKGRERSEDRNGCTHLIILGMGQTAEGYKRTRNEKVKRRTRARLGISPGLPILKRERWIPAERQAQANGRPESADLSSSNGRGYLLRRCDARSGNVLAARGRGVGRIKGSVARGRGPAGVGPCQMVPVISDRVAFGRRM